jgi:hypothetical protein
MKSQDFFFSLANVSCEDVSAETLARSFHSTQCVGLQRSIRFTAIAFYYSAAFNHSA